MSITANQKQIIAECMQKGSGCMKLHMGSGKTLIALTMAIEYSRRASYPALIIVSKTLIGSWIAEIEKFFGDELKYEVLHREYLKRSYTNWRPQPDTQIVLTTEQVLTSVYNSHNIARYVTREERRDNLVTVTRYINLRQPVLNANLGIALLYSTRWAALFVDEIQNYTKITSKKCRSLGGIVAGNRWGLSGLVLQEPTTERLLGFYYILDMEAPRVLPDFSDWIKSAEFKGLDSIMVIRETNLDFTEKPEVIEEIVTNHLTTEEGQIYTTMREIMVVLNKKVKQLKAAGDTEGSRKFSSYRLVLLNYFRQILTCPILPITTAIVDLVEYKGKSELSTILLDHIDKLNLNEWLDQPEAITSSRILKILEKIEEHQGENILVFGCFKSCLDVLFYHLQDRPRVFMLDAKTSINKRTAIYEEFSKTKGAILLMTYQLGACGLNLQAATTILLTDFPWNRDTRDQAIARIVRMGQQSKQVHVVMFTSNTAVEKAILGKALSKLKVYKELRAGPTQLEVEKIDMKMIMQLIEAEVNEEMMLKVNREKV